MDALTRLSKPRGGVSLPEVTEVHVLRDPPSSIHTRKKERVESGDVNYNLRANPDRYSDALQQFQRGVNPQGSVDYSGRNGLGSRTLHLSRRSAHTPYNVVADGAFRPPMVRMEDELPLSRQKRDWTSVNSGVSLGSSGIGMPKHTVNEYTIDHEPLRGTIHPSFAYVIGQGAQNTYSGNAVMDPLTWAVSTNAARPGGTGRPGGDSAAVARMMAQDDRARVMDVAAKVSADMFGVSKTQRGANGWNPVDKVNYSVASALGGASASVTRSSMSDAGMQRRVLTDSELLNVAAGTNIAAPWLTKNLEDSSYTDVDLVRRQPGTSVNSRIFYEMKTQPDVLAPILDQNRPVVSAFAAPNRANNIAQWMTDVTLKDSGARAGATGRGYVDRSAELDPGFLRNLNPGVLTGGPVPQLAARESARRELADRRAKADYLSGNVAVVV